MMHHCGGKRTTILRSGRHGCMQVPADQRKCTFKGMCLCGAWALPDPVHEGEQGCFTRMGEIACGSKLRAKLRPVEYRVGGPGAKGQNAVRYSGLVFRQKTSEEKTSGGKHGLVQVPEAYTRHRRYRQRRSHPEGGQEHFHAHRSH